MVVDIDFMTNYQDKFEEYKELFKDIGQYKVQIDNLNKVLIHLEEGIFSLEEVFKIHHIIDAPVSRQVIEVLRKFTKEISNLSDKLEQLNPHMKILHDDYYNTAHFFVSFLTDHKGPKLYSFFQQIEDILEKIHEVLIRENLSMRNFNDVSKITEVKFIQRYFSTLASKEKELLKLMRRLKKILIDLKEGKILKEFFYLFKRKYTFKIIPKIIRIIF